MTVGSRGWVMPSFLPVLIKGRDMMVWYYKKFVLKVKADDNAAKPKQPKKDFIDVTS